MLVEITMQFSACPQDEATVRGEAKVAKSLRPDTKQATLAVLILFAPDNHWVYRLRSL